MREKEKKGEQNNSGKPIVIFEIPGSIVKSTVDLSKKSAVGINTVNDRQQRKWADSLSI